MTIDPNDINALLNRTQTVKANIIESDCIGCLKCIKACPFDTIVGAAQKMHSVITDECTGCELCVPACPVDCIELIPANETFDKDKARIRFNAKKKREQQSRYYEQEAYEDITFKKEEDPKAARLKAIQDAVTRQKKKG